LGIDGLAPTVTFNIVTFSTGALPGGASGYYPGPGANCNGGILTPDPALICGHDGNHYYRKGETNPVVLIATDTGGSGVTASGVTYSIAGSATCNALAPCPVTAAAGVGNFSFVPDFSTATFSSGVDGTDNTVSITVNVKDAVGNSSAPTTSTIGVTRVKWVRKTTMTSLAGAPIVSPLFHQVIVAGQNGTTDPIVGIDTSAASAGAQLWSTGAGLSPKITSVSTNMALDTTASTDATHPTPILYVNSGSTLYALHIGATSIDKYCTNSLATAPTGSPVIVGGGATAAVIITGGYQIGAFQTLNMTLSGGSCGLVDSRSFGSTSARPTVGPPSANGSNIYFGYNDAEAGGTGNVTIESISFNGSFGTASTTNIALEPTVSGATKAAVSPALDLFFGNDFNHKLYDYTTALVPSHTSPSLTSALFAQPTVSGVLVFGMTNQLIAYNSSDLSSAWTALTSVTQVTPPAVGVGMLYLSDASAKVIHAIDSLTGTTTRSDKWTYGGSGTTAISSLTTEPTLAPDGTLYFGDSVGKVYAIITDSAQATTGANDWPRTGYDNCNSNHAANTGYACQ
jgi:hypothetical protein